MRQLLVVCKITFILCNLAFILCNVTEINGCEQFLSTILHKMNAKLHNTDEPCTREVLHN